FHLDTSFLFGINLGKNDITHILPVLAAALTFVSIRMAILKNRANQQAQSQPVVQNKPAGPDPNAASMKMMQYMMPIVTLISASVFQAGLALYWVTTTAFSIGQQYFVNGRNWGPIQNDVNMVLGFVGLGNRGKTTVVEEPAPQIRPGRRRQIVDSLPSAKDNLKQQPALLEAPANGNGDNPAPAPKPRPTAPRPQPAKKTPAVRLASSANGASAGAPIKVATSANGAAISVARAPKAPTVSRPKSTSTGRSSKSSQARRKK
ncbi:MAG TPA: YidC/Oxa1 family membrane protein insertase, partial [Ktedonobacterales bacterium]|nr:YidC/Oxa1 family membrane protein insertase [Ktedonobacterales bacterium]